MTTTTDTPDDGVLAAEYVMHLLSPREETAFEDRLSREPDLLQYVTFWATRLSPLNDGVADARVPARVRRELMQRLFGDDEARPFRQGAGPWQIVAFASVLLAAFLAVQMQRLPDPVAPQPVLIGEIAAQDQSLRLLAVFDPQAGRLTVMRTDGQASAGRVHELWAIAPDAAPVSLGVLPDIATAAVSLPQDLRAQIDRLTLAISDEPPGGSPTGAPTGAVLALGQIGRI